MLDMKEGRIKFCLDARSRDVSDFLKLKLKELCATFNSHSFDLDDVRLDDK